MSDHLNEFAKLETETLMFWFGTAFFLAGLSFARTGIKDGLVFFVVNLFVYFMARFSHLSNIVSIVVTTVAWFVIYFFVRRMIHI